VTRKLLVQSLHTAENNKSTPVACAVVEDGTRRDEAKIGDGICNLQMLIHLTRLRVGKLEESSESNEKADLI
jgi:hypothetical protein